MTPEQFETEVIHRFPALTKDIEEDAGLLHVVMGHLYRYTQVRIAAYEWEEVDRVFRLLDEACSASGYTTEMENAIRVSFLEYFDFHGREERIRKLLGAKLSYLYDDHMLYMDRLSQGKKDRS